MTERDPIPGLDTLAHAAEQYAAPLPPEDVRRLGTRRRRRRHVAVGAAAAVVVLAVGAGAVASQTVLQSNRLPDPANTPSVATTQSASPTPLRVLGPDNLLTADDITSAAGGQAEVVEVDQGVGREPESISVCIPAGGYSELAARQSANRNFRYAEQDPDYKLAGEPGFYTQALQFDDAAAATEAQRVIEGWVTDCADTIAESYELIRPGWEPEWYPVEVGGERVGAFTELPLYVDADDSSENGNFESIGVTRVDDRLMLTVVLDYSNESHWAYTKDDPTGLPMHPQFGMIDSSAERLAN